MSEFLTVETQFSDKNCLIFALEKIYGINSVEYHSTPANLLGYQGDIRQQKANIIVRKEQIGRASNDLGFLLQPDGTYQMIVSEYDRRQKRVPLAALKQHYANKRIRTEARKKGFTVREVKKGNIIELKLTR